MSCELTIAPHPLLDVAVFVTQLPSPLGTLATPDAISGLAVLDTEAPLTRSDDTKTRVRDLLRHAGFRPSGRSKPASEYLIAAVRKGWLSPERSINLAVDACNVVSLHSGLPISVIDLDRADQPLQIAACAPDTRYEFNPSGQIIDVSHLLCLHDAQGPCAGPVKDSQRTKTHPETTRTLSIVWGTRDLPGRTHHTLRWYRQLLHDAGATTELLVAPTVPA